MTRVIEKSTKGFTRKHIINSANGKAIQSINGTIKVKECACLVTQDDEGEQGHVAVIIADNGDCYTGISSSAYHVTKDLVDIVDEDGPCEIKVELRESKSGREFVAITIL